MIESKRLDKDLTVKEVLTLMETGHVYIMPLVVGREAYIIANKKPSKVIVTDISVKSIQLSGQWYTWEEINKLGGVYESEFGALQHVTMGI